MRKESNLISTKENTINEKLYPIEKEERQIMRLEKACSILSIALKVEMVITLVVMTFAFIAEGFPSSLKYQEKNEKSSISREIN